MLDAIAQSNGSDDSMAALQLLSHLEGEVKRATQTVLVGAHTEHYGSPGRLVDYRR